MMFVILLFGGAFRHVAESHISMDTTMSMPWTLYFPGHAGQLVGALLCMAVVGRGHFRKFGLRAPTGPSYIMPALAWGLAFGLIMTVVDYLPNLVGHRPPDLPLTATNVAGWLAFEAFWAGTVEEVAFRGLLVTFLMRRFSARIRIGGYDMHAAGVIIAVLFSLAHLHSFWSRPLFEAAGQQVYAFALAILYAYWYEKSGSLIAPIIGHNLGNTVEYILAFGMVRLWT